MDDGKEEDLNKPLKKTINHGNQKPTKDEPKFKLTEEDRRIRSEAMKAFNRKTGKNTALYNMLVRRSRGPK